MSEAALASYLLAHIPLTGAMGVTVDRAGPDEVVLAAPLDPNVNVHGTVFGGASRRWAFWPPGRCCTCGSRPRAWATSS